MPRNANDQGLRLQAPWWAPARHADRRPLLLARNRIKAALRAHFEAQDFVEAEPAALQVSPGNEAHLHAFETALRAPAEADRRLYLHTSPEFALKKLVTAGETRLFAFAPVYRNRECGPLHHPEFTMLEWYRAGEPYEALMDDAGALLARAAEAAGAKRLRFRDREADPYLPPERISVRDAFQRFCGIDLAATIREDGTTNRPALARAAVASGHRVADDDTWSDLFSGLMVERIEPRLGQDRATILCEYPLAEAALARPLAPDPRFAERFELYACGVELANAFGELTDPAEQRRRFEAEMAEKLRVHGESYPLDEDFLAALALMPEASGIALGFDRLAMLATGAPRITDVIWTPVAVSGEDGA